MKKKRFIDAHKDVFWPDRSEEERKKMLSDVYDTITGTTDNPEEEETPEAEDPKKEDKPKKK